MKELSTVQRREVILDALYMRLHDKVEKLAAFIRDISFFGLCHRL